MTLWATMLEISLTGVLGAAAAGASFFTLPCAATEAAQGKNKYMMSS
jgi:hypothetical protein